MAPAFTTNEPLPRSIAQLPAELRALMSRSFPRFSDAEYARRERLLGGIMQRNDVDHLIVVTLHRVGNATEWIMAWPGWIETITVFKPGERMAALRPIC